MTKDETARTLANLHYEVESGLMQVYRLYAPPDVEANPDEPVKLLEVHELTVPAGIMPLRFGPMKSRNINHKSVIVEVTPDEFRQIENGDLAFPDHWRIGELLDNPHHFAVAS